MMKKAKQILPILIILFGMTACKTQSLPITFELLSQDTSSNFQENKNVKYLNKYFIMSNFRNYVDQKHQIDSFANIQGEKLSKVYDEVSIVFYKTSKKTNLKNLKQNPRDLDRYSNIYDYKFNFLWSKGYFFKKYEYKNGKMLGKSQVYLSAPPDK